MEDTDSILTIKNAIDGIWINNNKDSKITTKIIISNNGKNVQIFDKCSPKYYDNETNTLTPEGYSTNMYWAIFNSCVSKSTFIFTIDDNKMEVRYEQDYKSTSIEPERFVENFTKLDSAIHEPVMTQTYLETKAQTEMELEDIPTQVLDNTPILLCDDLFANNDIENLYETTKVGMKISTIKDLTSGFFYYLPSTYHLQYNNDKSYGILKRGLNVLTYIKNIFSRVGNIVSIRRLISPTDMIT
ncbi:hypothetical protein Q4Q39_15610 [Flavivirga amylovorans]|uniref:Uncharacterized protein n=1 Tax=Flavivirga amylovorans TaxID=870486 RepID=A0ABT8X578_9FLAO|nr:hypothetical protein [Flavivirga amylovorans]MDO5988837.1 hypothetical protein [Flavivirga amylovorans]